MQSQLISSIANFRTGLVQTAAIAMMGLGAAVGWAAGTTYTTTGQFNSGSVIGVSTAGDELKLSSSGSTFPVLWVANAGEDTLTKFDIRLNKELARYRTWFGPAGEPGHSAHLGNPFAGAAPSRTAVDVDGNAYVLNRHFDGRSAVLIKILASTFIDRNGNGVADTSEDAGALNGIISDAEMMPLSDTNGNGIIDPGEIKDERVAWAVQVPDGGVAAVRSGLLGRSLCIAPSGNLWVGLYSESSYYEVRASDGLTLRGPVAVGVTPYGCLVDSSGKLFSANLGSAMGRLDTVTGLSLGAVGLIDGTYGIALDATHVFFAGNSRPFFRVRKSDLFQDDIAAGPDYFSVGISVDGDGNIVTGVYSGGGISKYKASDGSVICSNTGYPDMSETRGVIADGDGNVWQISVSGNLVAKYSSTCAKLGTFPVGNSPYTYSDAAGLAARSITTRTGDWNAVFDGLVAGASWGKVSWTATVPGGALLQVSRRVADSLVVLAGLPFTDAVNGANFVANGRFIEVRTRLTASLTGASPVVFDVTLAGTAAARCTVDLDSDIDQADLALISRARGQLATGPDDPRDADGDGRITPNDVKACIPRCTRANCAMQ